MRLFDRSVIFSTSLHLWCQAHRLRQDKECRPAVNASPFLAKAVARTPTCLTQVFSFSGKITREKDVARSFHVSGVNARDSWVCMHAASTLRRQCFCSFVITKGGLSPCSHSRYRSLSLSICVKQQLARPCTKETSIQFQTYASTRGHGMFVVRERTILEDKFSGNR